MHVVERATGRAGPTLAAWPAAEGRGAMLARFMDRGGIRAGLGARRVWNEAFPLLVPPDGPEGLGIMLMDSNAETHFSFTSALGLVGMAQCRAAEAAMRAWPQARWLVLLHHHLVEYPRAGAPLAARIGTALVNGHRVLGRLRRHAGRLVVLHGHRHLDWMGRCGGLRILSAPSPVMGVAAGAAGRIWLHRLAPAPGGGLALLRPVPLPVAAGGRP